LKPESIDIANMHEYGDDKRIFYNQNVHKYVELLIIELQGKDNNSPYLALRKRIV
jgi:hypothetical protein